MTSGVEDTPTVRNVQCGVVILAAVNVSIKVVTVRGGRVYGSRDTTENGGFLLVIFKVIKYSYSDWKIFM